MKFVFQYEVGDHVICLDTTSVIGVNAGETGVVVDIQPNNLQPNKYMIGVCWDKKVRNRHDCGGTCKKGHGWYVGPEQITLK